MLFPFSDACLLGFYWQTFQKQFNTKYRSFRVHWQLILHFLQVCLLKSCMYRVITLNDETYFKDDLYEFSRLNGLVCKCPKTLAFEFNSLISAQVFKKLLEKFSSTFLWENTLKFFLLIYPFLFKTLWFSVSGEK